MVQESLTCPEIMLMEWGIEAKTDLKMWKKEVGACTGFGFGV